ncbi:LLM class flavin-dependent oxidoreductase [Streptomyces sp. NPDC003401]
MTPRSGRGLPHLAAAVDQPGVHDTGACVELVRLAERGGLDFVTLGDTFAGSRTGSGPGAAPGPAPDAAAVLSRAAPATHRVGLVPAVTVARTGSPRVAPPGTEPAHGALPHGEFLDGEPSHGDLLRGEAALAALDRAGRGRTGRWLDLSADEEPGHAGLSGPFPPGGPVRVADAGDGPARRTVARYADVVLARVTSRAQARSVRERLRSEAAESGREPDSLRVLAALLIDLGDGEHAAEPGHGGGGPRQSARGPLYRGGPVGLADLIASWHRDGAVDGFHLTPVEPRRDLERLVNGTVALLQHRGLFRTFYPGSTLREHLGLARPVGQYAAERA